MNHVTLSEVNAEEWISGTFEDKSCHKKKTIDFLCEVWRMRLSIFATFGEGTHHAPQPRISTDCFAPLRPSCICPAAAVATPPKAANIRGAKGIFEIC